MPKSKAPLSSEWLQMTGEYKLKAKIGRGAYGEVVRAKHRATGEDVAIKMIKVKSNPSLLIKLLREVKILRQLSQMPEARLHTTRLRDAVVASDFLESDSTLLFLVLDYVPLTLDSLMETSSVIQYSESDVKEIIYKFLCSMAFIHSAGLMHRDIKPQNILVDSNFDIKLCDFGFSRPTQEPLSQISKRRLSRHICTRPYRPPEICLLQKDYNEKVDIWGAGCILGELIVTSQEY